MSDPLWPENPCGPDLETTGDADYLNAVARLDGALPSSYFEFDKSALDFDADANTLRNLIGRSRDLRLLVLLAKWSILYRELAGFVDCVEAIAALLSNAWSLVHPTIADGEADYRCAILQTLDDMPTVILPFQHLTLFVTRRTGPVTFRNQLIASGALTARAGEKAPDVASIRTALVQAEPSELAAVRDLLVRSNKAVATILAACSEHGGPSAVPDLTRLSDLTGKMLAFLDSAVPREAQKAEGAVAPNEDVDARDGSVSLGSAVQITSTESAAAVLMQIAAYYQANEPSSPSLLLVRQAQRLVGKNFYEILQILFPRNADEAKIVLGGEPMIFVNLDQSPKDDDPPSEEAEASLGEADERPAEAPSEPPEIKYPPVPSRQVAQDLLDDVAKYYRIAEPSNPIPILCDRARAMSSLGFTALLKEVFASE